MTGIHGTRYGQPCVIICFYIHLQTNELPFGHGPWKPNRSREYLGDPWITEKIKQDEVMRVRTRKCNALHNVAHLVFHKPCLIHSNNPHILDELNQPISRIRPEETN